MKVLHVREVANVAATIIEGLNQLGHQAELRNLKIAGGSYPLPLKTLFLPNRIQEGMAANHYIREGNFDIVHIHMAYMGWLGIFGRYPYFLHCHGHDLRRNLHHPLLRRITVQALKRASHVYYSTPDLYRDAITVRPDAQFLPNPINTDRFQPCPKDDSSVLRVLLISRLWDIKGIDIAFDAVKEIKERCPSAEIHAFAWGPEWERYKDNPLVSFISTVPYSGMPDLINGYDVIIGQFELGIISMSELEGMACGKPVICDFRYPEFYDEPPPVLVANDARGVAEQALTVLESPSFRREIGEKGREWVLQRHSYLTIAKMVEEAYLGFLSHRS